jgi:dipeptidyl aminopeptidase
LSNWLVNAFNGEWLRTANATPIEVDVEKMKERRGLIDMV